MAKSVEELNPQDMEIIFQTLGGVLFAVLRAHGIQLEEIPKITGLEVNQKVTSEAGIQSPPQKCKWVDGEWKC
ncbi:MAG: hypothetical protein AB1801_08825 [Chloroflexota bacterium]